MKTTTRDTRAAAIKRVLKPHFPLVRVRFHKYNMGESIYIHTGVMRSWSEEVNQAWWKAHLVNPPPLTEQEQALVQERREAQEHNDRITQQVRQLVGSYEQIDRDETTGEILSGGNTYMHIS